MAQEPPRLDYATLGSPSPPMLKLFIIGLVTGSVISGTLWVAGGDLLDTIGWAWPLLWVILILKLTVSIALIYHDRWRGLGLGMFCSIGVGFLVFFGALCSRRGF